jgi:2-(1,2-epoxy-1,2-dihydrophenyl)acetyl-CoA isomerase
MTDYATILYEKLDRVGRLTLNRPRSLNAINVQMGHELVDALTRMEEDGEIRAIILTGAGRAFCAGDDLKGMEGEGFRKTTGPDDVKNYVYAPYRWTVVVAAMRRLPKPIIASVRGHAHGGGFNLAMGADLRFASDNATFAIPFVKRAMATGVNQLHYHVPLGIALEMAFTGESLDAFRAEKLGLVNRVVPDGALDDATLAFARGLAEGPTRSIALTKAAIYRGWWKDLEAAFEEQAIAQSFAGLTEDRQEGVQAFLEKRAPRFKGR